MPCEAIVAWAPDNFTTTSWGQGKDERTEQMPSRLCTMWQDADATALKYSNHGGRSRPHLTAVGRLTKTGDLSDRAAGSSHRGVKGRSHPGLWGGSPKRAGHRSGRRGAVPGRSRATNVGSGPTLSRSSATASEQALQVATGVRHFLRNKRQERATCGAAR